MKAIEIREGLKVGFEEFLKGATQMDTRSLEEFTQKLQRIIARRKRPNHSERELELINIIYSKFPAEQQKRYDELYKKLQQEIISEIEHKELLKLTELSENHNVKWLSALVELAQIRNVSIEEVKKQLGLEKLPPIQ